MLIKADIIPRRLTPGDWQVLYACIIISESLVGGAMGAGLNDTSCFEARQYYLTMLILPMYVYAATWYACANCNLIVCQSEQGQGYGLLPVRSAEYVAPTRLAAQSLASSLVVVSNENHPP